MSTMIPTMYEMPLSGNVNQWMLNSSSLVSINAMNAGNTETEIEIIQKVASYGRQLGRIGEALAVLLKEKGNGNRSKEDQKAINAFTEMMDEIIAMKAGFRAATDENLEAFTKTVHYWKENEPQKFESFRASIMKELKSP